MDLEWIRNIDRTSGSDWIEAKRRTFVVDSSIDWKPVQNTKMRGISVLDAFKMRSKHRFKRTLFIGTKQDIRIFEASKRHLNNSSTAAIVKCMSYVTRGI